MTRARFAAVLLGCAAIGCSGEEIPLTPGIVGTVPPNELSCAELTRADQKDGFVVFDGGFASCLSDGLECVVDEGALAASCGDGLYAVARCAIDRWTRWCVDAGAFAGDASTLEAAPFDDAAAD